MPTSRALCFALVSTLSWGAHAGSLDDLAGKLNTLVNGTGSTQPGSTQAAVSGDEGSLETEVLVGQWTFKDWEVSVVRDDDAAVTECIARTGDGLENRVQVTHLTNSQFSYPIIEYNHFEREERHEPLLVGGMELEFQFDGSAMLPGESEGIEESSDTRSYPFNNERALSWMAERNTMTIALAYDKSVLYTASLSGFTASYRKLVEHCGAAARGVI